MYVARKNGSVSVENSKECLFMVRLYNGIINASHQYNRNCEKNSIWFHQAGSGGKTVNERREKRRRRRITTKWSYTHLDVSAQWLASNVYFLPLNFNKCSLTVAKGKFVVLCTKIPSHFALMFKRSTSTAPSRTYTNNITARKQKDEQEKKNI